MIGTGSIQCAWSLPVIVKGTITPWLDGRPARDQPTLRLSKFSPVVLVGKLPGWYACRMPSLLAL